ncbi:MAG: nitrile hydratase subunit beta [Betaproteobacteria bacterium]|nr:nitrile hydratase subunit beta [Betaproteobacteria bacterium]
MDGIQDMGGLQGFGVIPPHTDERPFHAPWEPASYAVALLAAEKGLWTFDAGRHAIERIPARQYMSMTYFERVLCGMVTLSIEHGLVTREELEALAGGPIPMALSMGPGHAVRSDHPGFKIGDHVIVRDLMPPGHIRAPNYVRGKKGRVVRIAPLARFPGEAGHGLPAHKEPSYHVQFVSKDLWEEAEDGATVVVDIYQSYLDKI